MATQPLDSAAARTPLADTPTPGLARCSGAPRVLLLAADFITPYRVLRCAHAGGAEVFVLGNAGARPLRCSRHCRGLFVSERIIHGERDESLALEINCLARELQLDMIVPTDAPCTRALIAARDLIEAPCFPLPALAQFDQLNDKWSFAQLCSALEIAHPPTQLLADIAAVRRALAMERVRFPVILKPLNRCAGSGIRVLRDHADLRHLNAINYRPILLQQFLAGEDIGTSVYAAGGRIEAFIAHSLRRGEYRAFRDDRIYADIGRLVGQLQLDGVYNFDMIRMDDGSIFYLECNPRFFYKINLSMLAGINFLACGLPGTPHDVRPIPEVTVRSPRALLRALFSGRYRRRDWALTRHLLDDPVPWALERLGVLR